MDLFKQSHTGKYFENKNKFKPVAELEDARGPVSFSLVAPDIVCDNEVVAQLVNQNIKKHIVDDPGTDNVVAEPTLSDSLDKSDYDTVLQIDESDLSEHVDQIQNTDTTKESTTPPPQSHITVEPARFEDRVESDKVYDGFFNDTPPIRTGSSSKKPNLIRDYSTVDLEPRAEYDMYKYTPRLSPIQDVLQEDSNTENDIDKLLEEANKKIGKFSIPDAMNRAELDNLISKLSVPDIKDVPGPNLLTSTRPMSSVDDKEFETTSQNDIGKDDSRHRKQLDVDDDDDGDAINMLLNIFCKPPDVTDANYKAFKTVNCICVFLVEKIFSRSEAHSKKDRKKISKAATHLVFDYFADRISQYVIDMSSNSSTSKRTRSLLLAMLLILTIGEPLFLKRVDANKNSGIMCGEPVKKRAVSNERGSPVYHVLPDSKKPKLVHTNVYTSQNSFEHQPSAQSIMSINNDVVTENDRMMKTKKISFTTGRNSNTLERVSFKNKPLGLNRFYAPDF